MPHTYSRLWVHLVWSTKRRKPVLSDKIRKNLFFHIKKIGAEKGYNIIVVNGVEDHLHCLLSYNPKCSISDIVNELKGESSHWINENNLTKSKFYWQRGFGAFSVCESDLEVVKKYILNQEKHHKKITSKDELTLLLKE